MTDKNILETLEYNKIIEILSEYASSSLGKSLIMSLYPSDNLKDASVLLNETAEAYKILYEQMLTPVTDFDDINEEIQKTEIHSVLSCGEILKINKTLKASRITKNIISEADNSIILLKDYSENLYVNQTFENNIAKTIISETELADSASPELKKIRNKIRNLNASVKDKLSDFIKKPQTQKYLQENLVTLRAGRYVLPVKSEYRNSIQGLIHDQSASGATLFIEPISVVEINNELKSFQLEEQREINKILTGITLEIASFSEQLKNNLYILSKIDSIFAKAKYAADSRSILPRINDSGRINIIKGRHPLINKEKVIPIDINLGINFDILVITGPNTGGKTVSLKLTGLFCLMAASGIYIPAADDTEISIFDSICCDIGDKQSIENDMSTFSSHIVTINSILSKANENSLVLLDELGGGTDPKEGEALALAITEYLLKKKSKVIITSHYQAMKEYALTVKNIENASMEFDIDNFSPTYKLNIGIPGSSNALKIAKKLGLSDCVIDKAYSFLDSDKIKFDELINLAQKTILEAQKEKEFALNLKKQTNEELLKLNSDKVIFEKKQNDFYEKSHIKAKKIINDAIEEAEDIISEIKKEMQLAVSSQNILNAHKLKKKLENKLYNYNKYDNKSEDFIKADVNSLKPGDIIFIKSLNKEAVFKRKEGSKYLISIGNISSYVKGEDIGISNSAPHKKTSVNISISKKQEITSNEINLLGQTVDQAIYNTDLFIDSAVINGLEEIRIVHGCGTGALQKAIQSHLKNHRNVESYRYGKYGEGEKGVTIVKLK